MLESSITTTSWSIPSRERVETMLRTVSATEPSSLWAGMTTESFICQLSDPGRK